MATCLSACNMPLGSCCLLLVMPLLPSEQAHLCSLLATIAGRATQQMHTACYIAVWALVHHAALSIYVAHTEKRENGEISSTRSFVHGMQMTASNGDACPVPACHLALELDAVAARGRVLLRLKVVQRHAELAQYRVPQVLQLPQHLCFHCLLALLHLRFQPRDRTPRPI